MQRLPLIGSVVALLAAAAALWWILNAGGTQTEDATPLAYDVEERPVDEGLIFEKPEKGGVYGGKVLDREGKPIEGAKVLLIAYNAGDAYLMDRLRNSNELDPDAPIPVIGDYTPAGEAVTDVDGKFRIAADSQARISRVMAYHPPRYFLDVVQVTRPQEDLVLTLPRAGRFIGTVVDDESGRPIHGAVVDIYFQQKVAQAPNLEEGQDFRVIKRKTNKLQWLATLGRFIPKVLGPRLYGLPYEGGDTIRLRTDRNGHFEIGPLADGIQLEFVITHSQYAWFEFDTMGGKKAAKRTVVEPGETVEREFRMRKGEFVAGQVVDDTGKGVPDVLVEVQSISAYNRHWWYVYKWRRTFTDRSGKFRAEGLARGSQSLLLKHDSFGTIVESADAGTDSLVIVVERMGGLRGRVIGAPTGRSKRKVTVLLDASDENTKAPPQRREVVRLDRGNEFVLSGVAPGSYRVWLQAGKQSSMPVDVTIESQGVADADFELGGGGTISTRVHDVGGGVIDPATVRLIALVDGKERAMGTFVSREGEVSIDGIAPGRYRLQVQASGRIAAKTDPFEVSRDRSTVIAPVMLREWAFLEFSQPVDESGRPARIEGDVVVEVKEGEKGKFRRVFLTTGADLAVEPGPVDVRARMGEVRYEDRVQARDGETHSVKIVFPRR